MSDDERSSCGAHTRQCRACTVKWSSCIHAHDTKDCKDPDHGCTLARGFGTDHPGSGSCKHHAGQTPAGRKAAQGEAAEKALRGLGIPIAGSPIEVLAAAVDSAYGVMLAARALLEGAEGEHIQPRLRLYLDAIERAARVAKPAADAHIDEERLALAERQYALLHELLDVYALAVGADDEARARGTAAVIARIRERRVIVPELGPGAPVH
jgi:hypothetical protein